MMWKKNKKTAAKPIKIPLFSEKNKHIIDYLNYYCELTSPGYAVQLSGSWGCGKTWFVKEIIKSAPDKFLYMSLYGKKSVSEIEDELYCLLLPIIDAKIPKVISKLVFQGAKNFGLELPKFSIRDITPLKIEDRILVFDDSERSTLAQEELFGFINGFVEHQGSRVIILCNEDEYYPHEKNTVRGAIKQTDLSFKEKLVGATFKIEAEVDNAVAEFIQTASETPFKPVLEKHKTDIIQIFNQVGYNNLRALKQSIQGFVYFLGQFPEGLFAYEDYSDRIIDIYFYLTLEQKNGLKKEDWKRAYHGFKTGRINFKRQQEKSKLPSEEKKTQAAEWIESGEYDDNVLGNEIWGKVIFENEKVSNQLISLHQQLNDIERVQSKHIWRFLRNAYDLNEDEFKSLMEQMIADIDNHRITDIGEFLHITGFLLYCAKNGVIQETTEQISSKLSSSLELSDFDNDDVLTSIWGIDSYGGHAYPERGSPIFIEILEKLKRKNAAVKCHKLAKNFMTDISDVEQNFRSLIYKLNPAKTGGIYSSYPIFSHKEVQTAISGAFPSFNLIEIHSFISTLQERYHTKYSNNKVPDELKSEYEFVVSFLDYLTEKVNASPLYNLKVFTYRELQTLMENIKLAFERDFPDLKSVEATNQ